MGWGLGRSCLLPKSQVEAAARPTGSGWSPKKAEQGAEWGVGGKLAAIGLPRPFWVAELLGLDLWKLSCTWGSSRAPSEQPPGRHSTRQAAVSHLPFTPGSLLSSDLGVEKGRRRKPLTHPLLVTPKSGNQISIIPLFLN